MSAQDQTTANQTVTPDIDARNATQDILATATADGRFTELLAAVHGAGLEAVLQDPELVTVFAPSDEAIRQGNTDVFLRLMHRETRDQLAAVLRHHVLRGAVSAADLNTTDHVKMIDGTQLPIERDGADIRIGGARLVETDIACTNGVLHVLDAVLVPKH